MYPAIASARPAFRCMSPSASLAHGAKIMGMEMSGRSMIPACVKRARLSVVDSAASTNSSRAPLPCAWRANSRIFFHPSASSMDPGVRITNAQLSGASPSTVVVRRRSGIFSKCSPVCSLMCAMMGSCSEVLISFSVSVSPCRTITSDWEGRTSCSASITSGSCLSDASSRSARRLEAVMSLEIHSSLSRKSESITSFAKAASRF